MYPTVKGGLAWPAILVALAAAIVSGAGATLIETLAIA